MDVLCMLCSCNISCRCQHILETLVWTRGLSNPCADIFVYGGKGIKIQGDDIIGSFSLVWVRRVFWDAEHLNEVDNFSCAQRIVVGEPNHVTSKPTVHAVYEEKKFPDYMYCQGRPGHTSPDPGFGEAFLQGLEWGSTESHKRPTDQAFRYICQECQWYWEDTSDTASNWHRGCCTSSTATMLSSTCLCWGWEKWDWENAEVWNDMPFYFTMGFSIVSCEETRW